MTNHTCTRCHRTSYYCNCGTHALLAARAAATGRPLVIDRKESL